MKTYTAKTEDIQRNWFLIDAQGLPLGRVASVIASYLLGKHKVTFSPSMDMGDVIVLTNAAKIGATGNKENIKLYHRHTGYIGGLKTRTLKQMRSHAPAEIIKLAVKRMLPSGPLGRQMFKKLHVYADSNHPHQAQQPSVLTLSRTNLL